MSALNSIPAVVWSGITFVLGIATKSAVDTYMQRRETARKFAVEKRTAFLEQQLSCFYWPLYLHLQKDNLLQERRINRDQDPTTSASRLSMYVESNCILPNHQEAARVIESNLHLAGSSHVINESLKYVRHVKVYEMLQDAGVHEDPIAHKSPYPSGFFDLIKERAIAVQAQYDALIQYSEAPASVEKVTTNPPPPPHSVDAPRSTEFPPEATRLFKPLPGPDRR
jgi:hypothetical protein